MKYKMTKQEREAEARAICEALPLRPCEKAMADFRAEEYTEARSPFRSVWAEYDDGKKAKVVEVTCGYCMHSDTYQYAKIERNMGCCHMASYSMLPQDEYGFIDEGADGEEAILSSGNLYKCPNCGKISTAYNYSRLNHRVIKAVTHPVLDLRTVRGHLCVMLFKCEKAVGREGKEYVCFTREIAAYQVDGRMFRATGYESWYMGTKEYSDKWLLSADFRETISGVRRDLVYWDKKELRKAEEYNDGIKAYLSRTKSTSFLYPESYLALWARQPNAENIAKTYPRYFDRLISEHRGAPTLQYAKRYIDFKELKPHRMIGVAKDILKDLANKAGPATIFLYRLCRERGITPPEGLDKCSEQTADAIIRLLDEKAAKEVAPPLGKLIRYILSNGNDLPGYRSRTGELRDYWRLNIAIGLTVTPDIMFPADLIAAHDRLIILQEVEGNKKLKEAFRRQAEKFADMAFEDKDTGLMIVPCRSEEELIKEGKVLHHCVASYAEDIASGKTMIFFVRRIEAPDLPYFTLEYRKNEVVQNRGRFNCVRTKEVIDFEAKWLKYITKEAKNHGKRTAEKQAV